MKYAGHLAAGVLGFVFISAGLTVLLKLVPMPPPPPADTPAGMFMGAFGPTGYMTFVKLLEVLGGALVLVPRTRALGLMVLVPILVNIVAFHLFIMDGAGLFSPMLVAAVVAAAFLIWTLRRGIAGLLADRG
jgi:hypothetical protein